MEAHRLVTTDHPALRGDSQVADAAACHGVEAHAVHASDEREGDEADAHPEREPHDGQQGASRVAAQAAERVAKAGADHERIASTGSRRAVMRAGQTAAKIETTLTPITPAR